MYWEFSASFSVLTCLNWQHSHSCMYHGQFKCTDFFSTKQKRKTLKITRRPSTALINSKQQHFQVMEEWRMMKLWHKNDRCLIRLCCSASLYCWVVLCFCPSFLLLNVLHNHQPVSSAVFMWWRLLYRKQSPKEQNWFFIQRQQVHKLWAL